MDYKKKYEDAIENIKKIKTANKDNKELVDFIEYKYPELKEHEGDMFRQYLLSYCNDAIEKGRGLELAKSTTKQLKTWLEKQIEQKTADKIEPKFKVGDFIINEYGFIMHIDGIDSNMYVYHVLDDNRLLKHDITKTDESCHRWIIQDAKEGDVLAEKDRAILLFRGIGNKRYKDVIDFYALLEINMDNRFSIQKENGYWGSTSNCNLKPATKEQRDRLEKAMFNAGYKWDAEKKELKKIEQISNWNKEDEKFFNSALWHINNSVNNGLTGNGSSVCEWLKSLKQRIKGE